MPATSNDRHEASDSHSPVDRASDAHPQIDRRRVLQGLCATAAACVLGAASTERAAFTTADVAIPTFDGTTLAGTLYLPATPRPDRRAVLVPHCWARSDAEAHRHAAAVAAGGAVALKYDARGYGVSGGSAGAVDDIALRDARALVDWAVDEGVLAGAPRLVVF